MSHDQIERDQEVAVWVTSMVTGAPLEDAEVSLYGDDYPVRSALTRWQNKTLSAQSTNPTLLGEGITNADGLAYVEGIEDMELLIAVVRVGSNFVYVPDVRIGHVQQRSYQDTVVLDRSLVRPGETLHVKGTLQLRNESKR